MLEDNKDYGRTINLSTLQTVVHSLGFVPSQVLNVWMDAQCVRVEYITNQGRRITEELRVIKTIEKL